MSSAQTAPGGPPVAREIVVPALVGIITSVVTDAIGNAPTAVQLLVATALGGAVWWLMSRRTSAPAPAAPAPAAAAPAAPTRAAPTQDAPAPTAAAPAAPTPAAPVPGERPARPSPVRLILLAMAAVALVGVGVVAGLAVEWRPTALILGAWLLALVGVVLSLPRTPAPLSRAAAPLVAAGIGCAIGLSVFELGVLARYSFFPPQPPPATVPRQLSTPDRLSYNMRAIGDFPLTETADDRLQVHVRWETRDTDGRTEIVTTAVAVRLGHVVVAVDGEEPDRIRVNGESTAVPEQGLRANEVTILRSGATTEVSAGRLRVALTTQDGVVSRIDLNVPADYRGRLRGLLGDFDGNPANDLRLRDGTIVRHGGDPASVQDVIDRRFARSWRLRPEQGLLG